MRKKKRKQQFICHMEVIERILKESLLISVGDVEKLPLWVNVQTVAKIH